MRRDRGAEVTHRKTVRLWCHECQAFVEFEGWVHEDGKSAPVHVTPVETDLHRVQVHGATS